MNNRLKGCCILSLSFHHTSCVGSPRNISGMIVYQEVDSISIEGMVQYAYLSTNKYFAPFQVSVPSVLGWADSIKTQGATRKHSSRMRTAHLPTVCVMVNPNRCQYWWGWVSQDLCPVGWGGYTMGSGIPTPVHTHITPRTRPLPGHAHPLDTPTPC